MAQSATAGHLFDDASDGQRQVDGAMAQNHDALLAIEPGPERQDLFEGLAADYERVDAGQRRSLTSACTWLS